MRKSVWRHAKLNAEASGEMRAGRIAAGNFHIEPAHVGFSQQHPPVLQPQSCQILCGHYTQSRLEKTLNLPPGNADISGAYLDRQGFFQVLFQIGHSLQHMRVAIAHPRRSRSGRRYIIPSSPASTSRQYARIVRGWVMSPQLLSDSSAACCAQGQAAANAATEETLRVDGPVRASSPNVALN